MPEEISLSKAIDLLNSGRGTKTAEQWPTPYREIIRKAVDSGESFVILEGRSFKLSITATKFHLKPTKGFVPCGWFDRDWLGEVD